MPGRSKIIINGVGYEVEASEVTGAQLRAIASLDPVIDLVVEGDPDRLIADEDVVSLKGATVRAFTRPPTSMG